MSDVHYILLISCIYSLKTKYLVVFKCLHFSLTLRVDASSQYFLIYICPKLFLPEMLLGFGLEAEIYEIPSRNSVCDASIIGINVVIVTLNFNFCNKPLS